MDEPTFTENYSEDAEKNAEQFMTWLHESASWRFHDALIKKIGGKCVYKMSNGKYCGEV